VLVPPKPGAGDSLILKIFKTWDQSSVILNSKKTKEKSEPVAISKTKEPQDSNCYDSLLVIAIFNNCQVGFFWIFRDPTSYQYQYQYQKIVPDKLSKKS
jgi:hypothetical protein